MAPVSVQRRSVCQSASADDGCVELQRRDTGLTVDLNGWGQSPISFSCSRFGEVVFLNRDLTPESQNLTSTLL